MAYSISEECIACGECASKCPVGAIRGDDRGYTIDSGECTECGSCAEICPVAAAQKA